MLTHRRGRRERAPGEARVKARTAARRWQRWGRAIAFLAGCACAAAVCAPATADAPQEVHGVADAYAAPGVTLAWGILRGTDEATTQVVLRIVTDPQIYPTVAAVARNPFSERQQALLPATPTAGGVEVRVPRAQYADFPRTELRFYASAAALKADTPALVVFYLGVPDTTPEFASQANLDAYLAERIARAAGSAGK
jgi:hypothetical protein